MTSRARDLLDKNPASDASDPSTAGWSIFLRSFSGPDAQTRASQFADALATQWGLSEAFAESRESGSTVLYGHYEEMSSAQAQNDLASIRSMGDGANKLFPAAFLLHRQGSGEGRYPEIALRSAREEFGNSTLFTLQIGVYDSSDRTESMRAAEDAALALRQQGEQAFYHHGPSRSMVTIGVFSLRDFDPQTGRTSKRLDALREKYPHNLFNGMGLREHTVTGSSRIQPSGLVMIPE